MSIQVNEKIVVHKKGFDIMEIELGQINKATYEDLELEKVLNKYYFIKKLVLNSTTYPSLEIEQLDLCPNNDEEFTIWVKISANLKKEELFNLLKVANDNTNFELGGDNEFPAKITIETFPRKKDID